MANEPTDPHSKNAFSMPAIDKSNQRYLLAVKDFNDRAVACRRENDYECAIKNYNDALRIDCKSAVLYNNRGVVHLEQNEYDLAISDFSKTLKIDPDFSRAYRLLSRLLEPDSKAVTAEPKRRLLTREED